MNEKIIYSNNNYQVFEDGFVAIDNNVIDYPKDVIRELANELSAQEDECINLRNGYEAICKSFNAIRTENNKNRHALERIKKIAQECMYIDDREAIADILNIFDELEKEEENG